MIWGGWTCRTAPSCWGVAQKVVVVVVTAFLGTVFTRFCYFPHCWGWVFFFLRSTTGSEHVCGCIVLKMSLREPRIRHRGNQGFGEFEGGGIQFYLWCFFLCSKSCWKLLFSYLAIRYCRVSPFSILYIPITKGLVLAGELGSFASFLKCIFEAGKVPHDNSANIPSM